MAKIIEYKVIRMDELSNLSSEVNYWIIEGWQPLGDMSVTSNWYYQAMVKYEERPKRETAYRGRNVADMSDDELVALKKSFGDK